MELRSARPADLPAAARLLASSLRFSPADAVPPWLMQVTAECGGVTLVAADARVVAGALHSIAGHCDGVPSLFTCGLAVAPAYRGRGVGAALMREQRRRALAAGCASIRWTADPVNGRALRLYLSGLGARLTGYRAGLHDGLRADPGYPQDDVEVMWRLDGTPAPRAREFGEVELPWSAPAPADRRRVGAEMSDLLAGDYVGTAVRLDRPERRCWVVFER